MLNEQQFYLCVQIQTSQTGGPPYSDSSPYGECSLLQVSIFFLLSLYFRYSLLSVRLPFNLNASLTNPGRKIQPFGKFIPLGVSSKLALSSYPDVLKWGGGVVGRSVPPNLVLKFLSSPTFLSTSFVFVFRLKVN